MVSPVVRPSVSVSKSISSLGFVVETDERMSITLVEDEEAIPIHILKRTENDTTDGTKPLEIQGALEGNRELLAETYDETKEGIKKERSEQIVKYGSKDAHKIEEDLAQYVAQGISQRGSTDSVFIGNVSIEPITFEKTLEKITEDVAAQATLLQSQAETSDKTTYTSFSLIQREDKSTSVVSQSLVDIAKRRSSGKPEFCSLWIKPKKDYSKFMKLFEISYNDVLVHTHLQPHSARDVNNYT